MYSFKEYIKEAYPPDSSLRKEIVNKVKSGTPHKIAIAMAWTKYKENKKVTKDSLETNPYYKAKQGIS